MAEEENDASLVEEIGNELASFEEKFEEFRIDTSLSEEYDANNAIVTIHAGVGGTEACDWAPVSYTHLDVYKRQVRLPLEQRQQVESLVQQAWQPEAVRQVQQE